MYSQSSSQIGLYLPTFQMISHIFTRQIVFTNRCMWCDVMMSCTIHYPLEVKTSLMFDYIVYVKELHDYITCLEKTHYNLCMSQF